MKVAVLNSGSSSLKFDLVDVTDRDGRLSVRTLAQGKIDHIGHEASLEVRAEGSEPLRRTVGITSHRDAFAQALDAWGELFPGNGGLRLQAVGHRVVHGGADFTSPVLIDGSVVTALESLSELAPLHNPAALDGIRAARQVLGPNVPMVAVFDTAFHATLPEYAYTYALPYETRQRHRIRRYGFHGTAHEYMLTRYSDREGISSQQATIITLQLGNGCSATAIRAGRSVDTSMGFTPLEGLVMGTRSGDLDPGIMRYLADKESISAEEVERLLNERSGLLGISGRSGDMRDLLAAVADGDPRAQLAVEVFCYRVRKYIGSYLAALGGANAVVFGGGIGENAPAIRTRICEGLEWCGLQLDKARNTAMIGQEGRISADDAPIAAYVVPVNEAILIAQQTVACIGMRDISGTE